MGRTRATNATNTNSNAVVNQATNTNDEILNSGVGATEKDIPQTTVVIEEDLNLDAKVTVRNLAGWKVTFARLQDGVGDVVIAEDGVQRLSRNEVIAQINSGNKLFTGSDGNGSHATLYIEDAPTRIWVGFETADSPQKVFTKKVVTDLFDMEQSQFEEKLPQYIKTRAEKYALVEAIKKLNLNDYRKIVFVTNYTGYKI